MSDSEKIKRTKELWESACRAPERRGIKRFRMKRFVAMRLADGTAPWWYRPVAFYSGWWPNKDEREGLA
jgi:hypothetical protein